MPKRPLLQLFFLIFLCLVIPISAILAFSFFDRQMYFDTFVSVIVVCGAIDTIKKMERKEFEKTGENFEVILLKLQPTFVAVLFLISVLKYYNFL